MEALARGRDSPTPEDAFKLPTHTGVMKTARSVVVGVVGAGTMGVGIAQSAAAAGHPVLVYDVAPGAAEQAVATARRRIARSVAQGLLDLGPEELQLSAVGSLAELADASVVIEAVVEDLAVKRALFADLETAVAPECVLASNTSSLSPAAIAAGLEHPQRVVGLHFFSPVPLMPLVEVVSAATTDGAIVEQVSGLARGWGRPWSGPRRRPGSS